MKTNKIAYFNDKGAHLFSNEFKGRPVTVSTQEKGIFIFGASTSFFEEPMEKQPFPGLIALMVHCEQNIWGHT